MDKITEIKAKIKNNIELTEEEIFYLYVVHFNSEPSENDNNGTKETVEDLFKKGVYYPYEFKSISASEIERENLSSKMIQFISYDNPDYWEIALNAVRQDKSVLFYINTWPCYNNSKIEQERYTEVAVAAVQQNGELIEAVPKPQIFPNYATVAIEAVKQNGFALRVVSQYSPNYWGIAKEAVREKGEAMRYVLKLDRYYRSTEKYEIWAKEYKEVAMEAVKQSGHAIKYVEETHPDYVEIAKEAIKYHIWALLFIKVSHPDYDEIASYALSQDETAAELIPELYYGRSKIIEKAQNKTSPQKPKVLVK